MSTEWLGPRFYRPSLDQVLRGALGPNTTHAHYVDYFRYPTHGRVHGVTSTRSPAIPRFTAITRSPQSTQGSDGSGCHR